MSETETTPQEGLNATMDQTQAQLLGELGIPEGAQVEFVVNLFFLNNGGLAMNAHGVNATPNAELVHRLLGHAQHTVFMQAAQQAEERPAPVVQAATPAEANLLAAVVNGVNGRLPH